MSRALAQRVAGLVADAYAAKADPPMGVELRQAFATWLGLGGRHARAALRGEVSHDAINDDLTHYESWSVRRGPRLVYIDEVDGQVGMR